MPGMVLEMLDSGLLPWVKQLTVLDFAFVPFDATCRSLVPSSWSMEVPVCNYSSLEQQKVPATTERTRQPPSLPGFNCNTNPVAHACVLISTHTQPRFSMPWPPMSHDCG
jgi:hypothetical protein